MNSILIFDDDVWEHIAMKLTLGVPLLRLTCKRFATIFSDSLTFHQKVAFSYYIRYRYYFGCSLLHVEKCKFLAKTIVHFRMFNVYREIAMFDWIIHLHIQALSRGSMTLISALLESRLRI